MKIYVFPADTAGCGNYRLIWPAQELTRRGHDVHVVIPKQRDQMLQGVMRGDVMTDVKIPADADVVVLQRVTHRHLVQAIPLMRRKGVAVVVDFDDDLTCIHPANPAFGMLHPRNGNVDHSWKNTLRAAEAATLVTVSTPALIKRYGHMGNGEVLYNMVPRRFLDVERVDSDVIGWGGSVHSHPTDLQALGSSVAQLLQNGHKLRIVGPISGVHEALGVSRATAIEHTGVIPNIYEWPNAVATIGIGVAPLAVSKFNSSKSWLKMAEYAAAGVPCVGSPRDEYTRLHKLGVGLLASKPNDWFQKVGRLAGDAGERRELGERGREVMRDLTVEENAWRWLDAWKLAFTLERSTRSNPLARVVV